MTRNPNAISVTELTTILAKLSGQEITTSHLNADLAAGAPKNSDGTIHLVHYAAWLIQKQNQSNEETHG